ncbi:hypothetical protein [Lactiplantibacillus plajomi]|uniref:Extracellular protein n=1 Tax=Lactiplantibacillus plajomi TaxID=1457217 RepID=A0ABV6K4D7_9LACO|nr:hypothetical protein [Lactiplantibacillus plajomi]
MQLKRKVKLGLVTAASAVVVGLAVTPLVTNTLHAASNNVTSVSQTTAPLTVKATNQTVSAKSASGTKANYSVKYTDQQSQKTATYKKTDYNSTQTAQAKVEHLGTTQGDQVTLRGGEKATVQGVMGRIYVHWNTGNWSVTAIANTPDVANDPAKFANTVNQQIKAQKLTAKKVTTGAVTVYNQTQSGQANSVKWQQADQVAQVKGQQANTVLKIAAKADQ